MGNLNHALNLYKDEVAKKVEEKIALFKEQDKASEEVIKDFIAGFGIERKGCAVCHKIKSPLEFRWYAKKEKKLQWACKVCHKKIDDYNKDKGKKGQKVDEWLGKFATAKDTKAYNEYKGLGGL